MLRVLAVLLLITGISVSAVVPSDANSAVEFQDLAPGEAKIWYLYHCGYAVQTSEHLLIFDYWEPEEETHGGTIAQGIINPEEIKNLVVRVFISHSHMDHWDERVLAWQEIIPDIEYYFGWQAFEKPSYNYLPFPRSSYKDDTLEIFTVNSHHSGVPEAAFFVKVDGLNIFHVGDYQGKMVKGGDSNAAEDMDYLRKQSNLGNAGIDMIFICSWFGGPNPTIVKSLDPKVIFPTHGGGKESDYLEFAEDCADGGVTASVLCPKTRGDSFDYPN